MHVGKITKLFNEEQYGLIRTQSGKKVHFHQHCLWDISFDQLKEGQEVEFEMQVSYKGFLGFHIRPYVPNKPAADIVA